MKVISCDCFNKLLENKEGFDETELFILINEDETFTIDLN